VIYLIPLPENRLDRRGRASGWRQVPIERDGKSKLRELAGQLKDRGVTEVFASDLDKYAAECVAQELKAAVRTEFSLRRFNFGHCHGSPLAKAEGILKDLLSKWEHNADVPIRGGDSLTSFRKRWDRMYEKLTRLDCAALVADIQTIRWLKEREPHSLIRNGNTLSRDKVYCIRRLD
jgi:broad specificity phosphatase PhoE